MERVTLTDEVIQMRINHEASASIILLEQPAEGRRAFDLSLTPHFSLFYTGYCFFGDFWTSSTGWIYSCCSKELVNAREFLREVDIEKGLHSEKAGR